jgi:hypothetical protein
VLKVHGVIKLDGFIILSSIQLLLRTRIDVSGFAVGVSRLVAALFASRETRYPVWRL